MEKEKNIGVMVYQYLKVNIKTEKKMGKEKNIGVINQYLKVNIQMVKNNYINYKKMKLFLLKFNKDYNFCYYNS